MEGQISIFDWMPELLPKYPPITDITEEEAVQIVGDAIGVRFIWDSKFREYFGKVGKLKLTVRYGHYQLDDNHDLFISIGWNCGTSGGGAPMGSIEEAIDYFRRTIREE